MASLNDAAKALRDMPASAAMRGSDHSSAGDRCIAISALASRASERPLISPLATPASRG